MGSIKLTVKDLLVTELKKVGPETTIAQARKMTRFNKRILLLYEADKLIGLVSFCQINQTQLPTDTALKSIALTKFTVFDESYLQNEITKIITTTIKHPLVIADKNGEIYGAFMLDLLLLDLLEQVKFKESQLDTILDTAIEALCIIDRQARVNSWNKRAEKLYGIRSEEILGKKIDSYFSNLMVTEVIKKRKEIRSSYHQPCPGTHVLLSALPVLHNDQIIGGISAERDITEVVELNQKLTKANSKVRKLEQEISNISKKNNPFSTLKGHHKDMLALVDLASKVAPTEADILIHGETGSGKELLARSIHQASFRAKEPFIIVSCDAVPPSNFMEEMFGGAESNGLMADADNGTIFLDEISSMPLEVQAKLVQVLEGPGLERDIKPNIRLIASTEYTPNALLEQKLLREDLFYRLNVVTLIIPPLRERREDIPELAYFYLEEFCQLYGKKITRLDPTVISALLAYSWPGNITELKNVIKRMVVLTDNEVITEQVLPSQIKPAREPVEPQVSLNTATQNTERDLIISTLKQTGGNRSKAARLLNIPRSTFYYKMHQLGLL